VNHKQMVDGVQPGSAEARTMAHDNPVAMYKEVIFQKGNNHTKSLN
jgi:hypothetical protein